MPTEPTPLAEAAGVSSITETSRGELVKPRLLFFWSATSGHCRKVERYIAQVLQRNQNHHTFQLTRIDVESQPDLAERFKISSVPTLLVVADRRISARLTAPHNCLEIENALDPWLKR
jgi:thioredoxin 1